MLYSDNVTVEKEIEVKKAAAAKGLLVMGPTAADHHSRRCDGDCERQSHGAREHRGRRRNRLAGSPLCSSPARRRVLHGIGVGGRDVKKEVGGIMCLQAVGALLADDEVKVLA